MSSELIAPTIILGIIALVLFIIAYRRGKNEHIIGLKSAGDILIQIAPRLVFAFITAGLAQAITSMPIAAGLLQAGANIGTMVALITGWSLWAFSRLPIEIGIMGWRFTAVRLAVTFTFPIITGLLANLIFGGLTFP